MTDSTATMNVIKNSNMQINCRAKIKNSKEQQLVDAVVNAVRRNDTHISRIRFERNTKAWGSTSTRFVKQSYYSDDNTYELYVNLAKVTTKAGYTDLTDMQALLDVVLSVSSRTNSQDFINSMNKKYSLTA